MKFPSAGAHRRGKTKSSVIGMSKADLAAMGMAAQQEIEVEHGQPADTVRHARARGHLYRKVVP
jgi:hypothetical protein